jgi:DNA-binding NtrC family response regulator
MTTSILVVDDESTTQGTLGVFLEAEGYRVATAGSGREALTRIEAEEFDVIVTDVVMPGVSGLEVLERSRVLNPGAAVILMTGHATIRHILDVLARAQFDKRDAARLLGISLASLYRKLSVELPDGAADEEE